MTQANELDIGPLTWVKGEIDLALGRAAEAITAAEDPAQRSQLQFAQSHLHQACGALSIIGLDGASHFADTLGKLLAGMAGGDIPADEENIAIARRGCSAIANYLGELVSGADDQPLRLFALYREIASACGNSEVTPADMFFPDVGRRLPRRRLSGSSKPGDEPGAEGLRGARAALERGLLQWLRSPDDASGPNAMRDAAIALEAIQASPAFNTLWRVAQAFFDSLAHRDIPASEIRIKQLCAGLAKEVRQQASISHMVPERLMRDLLFEIGQAPVRTPAQRQVRELWNLDAWWADPGAIVADVPLGPLLRNLRNELTTAKQDWDAFSSGHENVLSEFDKRISHIAAESSQLGRPSLEQLLTGTATLTKWLGEDPARFDQTIAIDVATALLLAELSVEGGIADAELSAQAAASLARFEALMQGRQPPASETSFTAARRAHEWDARLQVTREIASNLGHIEQTLDDFFRNHAKHAPLAQLSTPLRQIDGALALIGGEQAQPLVRSASESIARLAQSADEPSEEVLTKLADQISTIGVFVNALQHGNADLNDILAPGDRSPPAPLADEIDFDVQEPSPELPTSRPQPEPVQRAEAPPPTAPTPSTEAEFDAELLAIFIEEAHEVLGTIAEGLQSMQPYGNEEALSGIRRGFHTLKGSGRMVGLTEFGEASWEIEQTLNRWLQLEWPVTPELHRLVSHAHEEFSRWVAQIEGGGSHSFKVGALIGEAEDLRLLDTADADSSGEVMVTPEEVSPEGNDETQFAAGTALDEDVIELETSVSDTEDEIPHGTPPEDMRAFFDFGDLPSLELDALSTGESSDASPDRPMETPEQAPPEPIPEEPLGEPGGFSTTQEPESEPELEPALDDAPEHASATADAVETAQASDGDEAAQKSPQVNIGGTELSRQLFDLYVTESRNHVAVLQSGLRALRSGTTIPSEKLLRTAHTLSGISGTAHVAPLQNLARAMEAALDRLREAHTPATPDQVDVLSITVDTLDAMLAEVVRERLPLAVPELEHQLDAIGRPLSVAAEGIDTGDQASAQAPEPDLPEATTAARSAADDTEHASTVHDDLDVQLLPIFLEEADELLANLNERLRHWEADSANTEHAQLAARQLHTLKGSARMAGAMRLGEHVHRIESRLESGIARQHEPARLIEELTSGLDQAAHMIAALSGQDVVPEQSPAQQTTTAVPSSAITIDAIGDSPDVMQGGGTLRVRAESLGGFINTAGEIGIARTRIEGELRTLRRSLLDLTENVIRLRNQLREVELQAETQMQSRIAQADSQHGEFDPLEMDRYTRLQELTRMMAESVGDVTTVQQALLRNLDGAEIALHSQARFARDLQQALMQVRMVPFDSLADRLHRVVRQSAKDQGKRVNLDIRGGRIEIDRSVLERMTVAVEHMLRNAVAHGIEPQDVRRAADKGEIGQITLSVSQIGNEIAIDLADDGRGLDYTAIEARARERELLEADEIADERRLTNLIFTPGFTTAASVSAIAGRGIGMDVVRAEAAALGGRIDVSATPGQGTRFRIYLPLTLAVTQALLVRAAHASYAIPSSMITQVLELRADAVERVRADGSVEWQGERYRYRYLPELLGDRRARPEIHRFNWVLLLRAGTEQLAVHIDALRGNQEIVVKAAGPQLLRVVGVSGATVLGDGEIVLILNPIALASRTEAPEEVIDAVMADDAFDHAAQASALARQPTILVVDDSLTVRKITSRLLEREGYRVLTAKDGTDALDQLEETLPDVILSDIEMPRMDGFDFVRNLRADDRTSAIPVIMITSRLADKHRDYAQKVGANEYLGKPYDEDELLRLLRRYIEAPVTHR